MHIPTGTASVVIALALVVPACRPGPPSPVPDPASSPVAATPAPSRPAAAPDSSTTPAPPRVVPTTPPPPAITQTIARIDEGSIFGHVRGLVAFGTRHTLSDTRSDTRGIGAARRFIKAQMEAAATASGKR